MYFEKLNKKNCKPITFFLVPFRGHERFPTSVLMMRRMRRRRRRRRRIEIWWGKGVFHDGIPPEAGAPHTHPSAPSLVPKRRSIFKAVFGSSNPCSIPFLLQLPHYIVVVLHPFTSSHVTARKKQERERR
jgi:hypothetical protein